MFVGEDATDADEDDERDHEEIDDSEDGFGLDVMREGESGD